MGHPSGPMRMPMLNQRIRDTLHLKRALGLIWQTGPGWTLAHAALLVLQGVLPLLSLYLMKLAIDAVTAAPAAPGTGVDFRRVGLLIGLTGGVSLAGVLCQSLSSLVKEAQAQVVTDHVHTVLHTKSIEVDLGYYENSKYYDTLHRAQYEAPYRPTRVVNGLVQVAQNGISLAAVAGLLLSFHWGIALVLLAASVPGVLVRLSYANTLFRWQRECTPAEREALYFNWMLTDGSHAKEIRLFGLGRFFIDKFDQLRSRLRHEKLEIAARHSAADLVTQASATLAIYGCFAFIAYKTMQGRATVGDLVMYYQAFQRGQGYLQGVLGGLAGLYEDNLFLSNFYEFLDLKSSIVEPAHPKPVPKPIVTGIIFDRVGFEYPGTGRKVLEEVSLRIRPGEHIALVGENGSGKTTLIKLLCRLYDPSRGSIRIDDIDLDRFETAALRSEIGVIFQDYAQYHQKAWENIWYGNPCEEPDRERIVCAARSSGADEILSKLPNGYDTVLGKWFEGGEELSIGEWQKVALARAFLRDAQIIVLDEPTSALDAKAEYEVFEKFHQLAKGRIALLVSHRLSTVRMADCIYVLEKGRIVESGTHEELMARRGTYAHLFETQAQYYR